MTALKIKENGEWKTVSYITGSKGKDGSTPNITYQVETLAAGSKATVTKSGTDASPILKFGIPRGANGSTPSLANYIPKTGSRGTISSYTSSNIVSGLTVNQNTPEESQVTGGTITVEPGSANTSWTKLVCITRNDVAISLGDSWVWSGGEAPTISENGILVLHWCNDIGVANLVDGATYLRTYAGVISVTGDTMLIQRGGTNICSFYAGETQTCELAVGDVFRHAVYSEQSAYAKVEVVTSSGITFQSYGVSGLVVASLADGYSATIKTTNLGGGSN